MRLHPRPRDPRECWTRSSLVSSVVGPLGIQATLVYVAHACHDGRKGGNVTRGKAIVLRGKKQGNLWGVEVALVVGGLGTKGVSWGNMQVT